MNRILVVKLADIGDVLTATPALRALRQSLPAAHITVLATAGSAAALRNLPSIDDIILFDKFQFDRPWDAIRPRALAGGWQFLRRLRSGRYDAVLIMHHLTTRWGALKYAALALASGAPRQLGLDNGRGWFLSQRVRDRGFGAVHEVDYWLEVAALLGAHTADRRLEIAVPAEAPAWAAARLPTSGPGYAVIHAGSGGFILARRWPPERFAAVADTLAGRFGLHIVLVGGPEEAALARDVATRVKQAVTNLAGETSIMQLAAVLAGCRLFVGGDSGVMHLAVAAQSPVVALFGPTNEHAWGPYTPPGSGLRAAVVRAPGTEPVMYVGHRLGKGRAAEGHSSMAAISVDMVMAAVDRIIGAHPDDQATIPTQGHKDTKTQGRDADET